MTEAKSAQRRLQQERHEIAELERQEPLRRRLLVALAKDSATPTALAKSVDAQLASVSRKLAEFKDAGLVRASKGSDDRRQVVYALTPAGRSEMSRHLALGERRPVVPPDREGVVAFMREALAGATGLRRRSNRLGDAIDRFEEIYAQAEELGERELALDALSELAATQRQDRRREELGHSIAVLEKMASGAPPVPPTLVLPAAAHLEYERGRASDLGEGELPEMVQRLLGASSLFAGLVDDRPGTNDAVWIRRRAWSVASLAGVLRQQSRYELALEHAAVALRMFDDLEDPYGRAHCWFLFGFCLRLLRRFDEAWSCLDYAYGIAVEAGNDFERASSNCLMQMGDVERCQGETVEAKRTLESSIELAESMDLSVTQAFARSAIGAAQFQEGDYEEARETLAAAQALFERAEHREGIALNARRQATVARHLSAAGVKLDSRATKALISKAQTAYRAVGSQTGVAACEIERGWMRTFSTRCGEVGPVVNRLGKMVSKMLDNPRQREALLLDAWLPFMLRDFAKEVAPDLLKDAKDVYRDAGRTLAEKGNMGVEMINEGQRRIKTDHKTQGDTAVIEMAGESRREQEPLALAAA
jgi:tetratricopeptide (TPR) repeat protein